LALILFYLGLGALLTFEEAGLFFLPGDISLVAAGLHATPTLSTLIISWVVASVGMTAGATVLFHGVAHTGRMRRVLPERVRHLVRRHGVWGVGVARVVPGLRNATVFAAGTSGLGYRRFLLGLVPAAFIWSGFLLMVGWFGGAGMLALMGSWHDSTALQAASFALLAAIAAFVAYRVWFRHALARKTS